MCAARAGRICRRSDTVTNMKNRCLYCGNDTSKAPCRTCFPPNVDRAQLEKLGIAGIDWRKDREAQNSIKMMMTNKLQGKVP